MFDSSALINIEDAACLDSLSRLRQQVIVPEKVVEELSRVPPGGRRPGSRARRMSTWLKNSSFEIGRFAVSDESTLYLRLLRTLGKGESAAIALARNRNAELIIDDRLARVVAEELQVICWSSPAFLQRLDGGAYTLL